MQCLLQSGSEIRRRILMDAVPFLIVQSQLDRQSVDLVALIGLNLYRKLIISRNPELAS